MKKPCHKCLLKDIGEVEFFQHIQEFIDNIPDHEKTPLDEYQRRIEICKTCDNLISGMCILCGCYVEVRAAKVWQHCVLQKFNW